MTKSSKAAGDAYLYGDSSECCPPLFEDNCSDGTIAVFYDPASESDLLLRWLGGSRQARFRRDVQKVMPYTAMPSGTAAGTPSSAVPLNCCDFGNGIETPVTCDITQDCFGEIKRKSDDLCDGGNDTPYCEDYPRWTVGGEQIDDEYDWHLSRVSDVLMQDAACQLLSGAGPKAFNPTGALDHWGLYSLLGFNNGNTAYPDYVYDCDYVKPDVIDWAGLPACAATDQTGVLVNGTPVTGEMTKSLYWMIWKIVNEKIKIFRRIRGAQSRNVSFGDVAIALPQDLIECLLRCQACYLMCDPGVTRIDNAEARAFYNQSLGTGIGFGAFRFNNLVVPFIPYDPVDPTTGESKMMNADGTYNMMLLFRGAGQSRFLYPEYQNLGDARSIQRGNAFTRNNGEMLFKWIDNGDCMALQGKKRWRWNNRTPYMQTLIKNISCADVLDLNASELPITAAAVADCP